MAFDALSKIKNYEKQAQEIINNGKKEANQKIIDTQKKCESLIAHKKALAQKEAENIFHKEILAAENEIQLLNDDFLSHSETLQLIIKRNTHKAIDAVINYFANGDEPHNDSTFI